MAKTLVEAVEKVMEGQKQAQIKHLIETFGIRAKLFKPVKNKSSRVYGIDSGEANEDNFVRIDCLVTSDDFFPTGPTSSGPFVEGFLYTLDPDVQVGDLLEIRRGDKRSNRYKIISKEAIGQTRDVFERYKIAAEPD